MLTLLFGILLGMFIAWFFVSPPAFAKTLRDKMIEKVPALGTFVRKD